MSAIRPLSPVPALSYPDTHESERGLAGKIREIITALNSFFVELVFKLNSLINGELGIIQLEPQSKEPKTAQKRKGTIAYADGVGWNPGAGGEGVYRWDGSAWTKMGT